MQHTNLSGSPYFDDFDETKNFHRVLFKPAPVQARELNQLQSITQNQIERLGTHLFNEGAMVIPGGITVKTDQDFATLVFSGNSQLTDIVGLENLYASSTTGLNAKVSKVIAPYGTDSTTLYLDYVSSGTAQEKIFSVGETITFYTKSADTLSQNLATATILTIGKAILAQVAEGVYFARGMFVRTPDQDVIVSKYTNENVSARVGFTVSEDIVDYHEDASLLSNAQGYPNYAAPGADRLRINLTLSTATLTDNSDDFIELARIEDGLVQTVVSDTSYALIEKAIAQRTYETNGDYTVSPFSIAIKEHLNDGTNGGVFTADEGGDATKLVCQIKPGVAYVKGYRVENIGLINLPFDKARDTTLLNNGVSSSDYGPYILVQNVASLPDIDIKKKIRLLDTLNTDLGFCRLRAVRKDGTSYRLYIFDLNLNSGQNFGSVKKVKYSDDSNLFTADLTSSLVYNSTLSNLFFAQPVSAVKTLINGVSNDTSYTVLRSFTVTTNSSGTAVIAAGSNEQFLGINSTDYAIALTGAATAGTQFDPSTVATLTGAPLGSSVTIALGSSFQNTAIRVIAPVNKSTPVQKTKTLTTVTNEAIVFTNTSSMALANSDIYAVTSVINADTNEDITSLFGLDNGQRSGFYQVGSIATLDGSNITRNVKVTYQYFAHSTGDYFSADSYGGMARELIPVVNGVSLADVMDFRPRKDATGDFTSSTVVGEIVRPSDTIRADVTYYLPRVDAVAVNSAGQFAVVRGIPSLKPVAPSIPSDAMLLYTLQIPAYTVSANNVGQVFVENKRYTMRDIGKLEGRIANVEYYTSLSALELQTATTQVVDPITGNNRFKNGFAVDGFTDYKLADINNPEWSAALDTTAGNLNPSFMENGTDLDTVNTSGFGYTKTADGVWIKQYAETTMITQPYATRTININPFAVFTWHGALSLYPAQDFWKDVKYLDPVVVNVTNNQRGNAVEGTVWTSWQGFDTVVSTRSVDSGLSYLELTSGNSWTQTTTNYATIQTTTVGTGVTTTFGESNNTSYADNLLGNTILPYMRSINIAFTGQGFKPFTRFYPFFDGVDISQDCYPTGGGYGQAIVADAAGTFTGVFTVPNRPDRCFPTGTSSFLFTDSPTNTFTQETSYGGTTFLSGGSVDTRQVTIVNTKTLYYTQTAAYTQSTSTKEVVTGQTTSSQWIAPPRERGGGGPAGGGDPIAQTFTIPVNGGAFISSVDIYFATKAASVPVRLQIRTVQTGLPTSQVIAEKILTPSQVNVSSNATIPTRFTFDSPFYLSDQVEFAMVLMADTQEYTVYISEMGQNVIGQPMALAKQPNLGVFLTSSNSTTWSPNQYQDLMFTMRRAMFSTTDAQLVLNGKDPIALPLGFNPVMTTNGSPLLTVTMKSHGLKVGDKVTLTGLVTGNGIVDTTVNGVQQTVTAATIDSFTFATGTNANLTGTIGGSNMKAVANYPFTSFLQNFETVNFSNTEVDWEFRVMSQASRQYSDWLAFTPKQTTQLTGEAIIRVGTDYQVRATMKNTVGNLSPVIDSSGATVVVVSPRLNNDFSNCVFNYVTSGIVFDNPSTSATFYVGAKLPNGSNMKLYYKLMNSADDDLSIKNWVELAPTTPIANDMSKFIEYTYKLGNVGTFAGYKIKIALTGTDPVSYPVLKDFRSIALA